MRSCVALAIMFAISLAMPVGQYQVPAEALADQMSQSAASARLAHQIGGSSGTMAVDGRLAFVAIGLHIQAFEVQPDGSNPRPVGSSSQLPSSPASLLVDGHHLYVGLLGLGVWVLDASKPTSLPVIGKLRTYSNGWRAAISRGYYYIADGAAGLRVVDVRDPSAPVLVTSIPISDRDLDENVTRANDVVTVGTHALVFFSDQYSNGELVAVFDLATPAAPSFVRIADIGAYCQSPSTARSGDLLFAVCGYRLFAFDVTDPVAVRLVGQANFPDFLASSIDVRDDLAVLSSSGYRPADGLGVAVVDVRDAEAMRMIGFVETRAGGGPVAWVGNAAVVVENPYGADDGIRHIDLSDPTQPKATGRSNWLGSASQVAAGAGRLFAGTQSRVWSFGETSLPSGSSLDLELGSMEVAGQYLYATVPGGRVAAFRIVGDSLTSVGAIAPDIPQGEFVLLTAHGNRVIAFGTNRERRGATPVREVQIIDFSSADQPVRLGRFDVTNATEHLATWQDSVLIAAGNALRIVDVSDPNNPLDRSGLTADAPIAGIAVDEDGHLFLASGTSLRVYAMGSDGPPSELGVHALPGTASAVDVASGRAIVVLEDAPAWSDDLRARIQIIDVRDPANMATWSAVGLPNTIGYPISQVVLEGERALLAGRPFGMLVVDVPGFTRPPVFLPLALAPR